MSDILEQLKQYRETNVVKTEAKEAEYIIRFESDELVLKAIDEIESLKNLLEYERVMHERTKNHYVHLREMLRRINKNNPKKGYDSSHSTNFL